MQGVVGPPGRVVGPPVRAFSFVELMIVLLIIGMVAGLAVPRLHRVLLVRRLETAERRLRADLELARARARAVAASQEVTFSIAPDPSRYEISGPSGIDAQITSYVVDLGISPYEVKIVAADFAGANKLIFNGHGIPTQSGTVMLEADGRQAEINVQAPVANWDQ